MNYKKVPIYGRITTTFGDYYLLAPHPIKGDDWHPYGSLMFDVLFWGELTEVIDNKREYIYHPTTALITPPFIIGYFTGERYVKENVDAPGETEGAGSGEVPRQETPVAEEGDRTSGPEDPAS